MDKRNEQRDRDIVTVIDGGMTASAVGEMLGISRERVRQLYFRQTGRGIPPRKTTCKHCGIRYEQRDGFQHRRSDGHEAALRSKGIERFWSHVDKNGPNGCWIWVGTRTGQGMRYPHVQIPRLSRNNIAYRVAWEITYGPIPDRMDIGHTCKVKLCCNPGHLYVATHSEVLRSFPHTVAAKNVAKTHCPQGHPYSGHNLIIDKTPTGQRRTCRQCILDRTARRKAR